MPTLRNQTCWNSARCSIEVVGNCLVEDSNGCMTTRLLDSPFCTNSMDSRSEGNMSLQSGMITSTKCTFPIRTGRLIRLVNTLWNASERGPTDSTHARVACARISSLKVAQPQGSAMEPPLCCKHIIWVLSCNSTATELGGWYRTSSCGSAAGGARWLDSAQASSSSPCLARASRMAMNKRLQYRTSS